MIMCKMKSEIHTQLHSNSTAHSPQEKKKHIRIKYAGLFGTANGFNLSVF